MTLQTISPNPITTTLGFAVQGALGSLMLSSMGGGSIAATAGSLSAVATISATGGAIVFLPWWIIYHAVDKSFKRRDFARHPDGTAIYGADMVDVIDRPIAHFCLLTLINTGALVSAICISAAIFGVAANPIILCALAGAATITLMCITLQALTISIIRWRMGSHTPAVETNSATYPATAITPPIAVAVPASIQTGEITASETATSTSPVNAYVLPTAFYTNAVTTGNSPTLFHTPVAEELVVNTSTATAEAVASVLSV